MVRIQLENGYLDVKEGTNFPVNLGIADIRDLSKRTGTFSKTITLEGTKNNHDLLNHYYDTNVVAGTFNINTLTKCSVIQNGIPVIEDAYLQLISILKSQSTMNQDEIITYEVLVKDARASFFTSLGTKELTDLNFTDLSHTWNAANVVASWSNTEADGYKYPMSWATGNEYTLNEFRPAIYAKTYFDRIFETNGFTYQWASLTANRFNKLIIPYNGENVFLDYEQYRVLATTTATFNVPNQWQTINSNINTDLTGWTETQDLSSIFTPATGIFTNPLVVSIPASFQVALTVTYDVNVVNTTGANAYVVGGSANYGFTAGLKKNGVGPLNGTYATAPGTNNNLVNLPNGYTAPNGTTLLGTRTVNLISQIASLLPGDTINVTVGLNPGITGSPQWRNLNDATGTIVPVTIQCVVTSVSMNAYYESNTIGAGAVIDPTDYVPKKIKQADFIKSIFTMYNLYVDVDETNTNNLILKTRDDFYDAGAEKDWSEKLAKDKDQSLQFLPELANKRLILTYKQDADEPNKVYKEATNEIYGQVEFIYDNEYIKGEEKKELLFSPTPIAQTTFGAVVPMYVGSAPKTNIRILYDGGTLPCSPFNIYDDITAGVGSFNLTSYPAITHFDNPLTPDYDINFATCDYYFYQPQILTNNNLYNNFWRRTVNQINTGQMLTAYFDLREIDIQSLKLNDKIRIYNSWWNINKVIDYNCNVPMLTKVELISVDNEIDFAPFKQSKPIIAAPPVGPVLDVLNETYSSNTNSIAPGSNVKVWGIGNVVSSGVNGVLVGSNKSAQGSGVFTDNLVNPYPVVYPLFAWNDTWTINDEQTLLVYEGTTNTTWTLPALGNIGQQFIIKNIGTGAVTIDGNGTQLIDNALTLKLNQWDSVTLVDAGSRWIII